MAKLLSQITPPTALLYLFVVVTQIFSGIYIAREAEFPPGYILLLRLGFLWIIGWWLQSDNRRHNIKWVYDMGLFLYIAWPLIIPYYLFKTRGLKALLTILIFVGIYAGANIIGAVGYVLFPA